MTLEALVLVVAVLGGLASGTVGIGGGAIVVPGLVYLPAVLGVRPLGIDQVSGLSIVLVGAASLLGGALHHRQAKADRRVVLAVGVPLIGTGILAALASASLPDAVSIVALALMASAAALLLVRPRAGVREESRDRGFRAGAAAGVGGLVGAGSGLLGAGGAWLLLPLLTDVVRVPIRTAITSSLVVTSIASVGIIAGKLLTDQVPLEYVPWGLLGVLPAAALSVRLSHRLPAAVLRRILAVIVLVIAVRAWADALSLFVG
ncbi:MAG: sulfite exporter TauE/SafE family protein [Chloroflexota bacterium]